MAKDHIGWGAVAPEVKQQISEHEARIDSGKCSKSTCPACHHRTGFARKDIRRRELRCFVPHAVTRQLVVATTPIRVARFRCIVCRYVFSDYPDFRTPP